MRVQAVAQPSVSRTTSGSASQHVPPYSHELHISHTLKSKASECSTAETSWCDAGTSRGGVEEAQHVAMVTTHPFGTPVEPDVYRT